MRDFADEVIRLGVASVHAHETDEFRRRGCLAGFELALRLDPENPNEWDAVLAERRARNREMMTEAYLSTDAFWEFECATAQIEHVYERLKVAWDVNGVRPAPSVSARAAMQYAEIIGIRRDE